MSKAKLKVARDLINELNYEAARAVLRGLPDDPTAREWLAKLDRIAPEAPPAEAGKTAPVPAVRPTPPDSIRHLPSNPALQPRAVTPLPRFDPEPAFPELEQKPRVTAPALRRAQRRVLWLRLWQMIWGGLALAALVWILYGIYGTFQGTHPLLGQIRQTVTGAVNEAAGTVGSQLPVGSEVTDTVRSTGDSLSTVVSLSFFTCSGLPFMLVFLSLYRRTSSTRRDERQHKEVLETMQAGQS